MDFMEKLYLEDIEDYCNVTFDKENLPAGVILAIDRMMSQDPSKYGVSSEKISDMSKTYMDPSILSQDWKSGLTKYCRPHLIGDKKKRPYKDGR